MCFLFCFDPAMHCQGAAIRTQTINAISYVPFEAIECFLRRCCLGVAAGAGRNFQGRGGNLLQPASSLGLSA